MARATREVPRLDRVQTAGVVAALVVAAIPWLVTFDGLSESGHRLLSVFLLAVVLWVTEAIPLHATAIVIIGLEVVLVSDGALFAVPDQAPAAADFFAALANPVIILFLGGFFIAHGASTFDLDRNLARVLLRPFGTSPRAIVLGVMLITAVLSMFMSNTATTATMMAVLLPVVTGLDTGDRLRTSLTLAVPLAANVGGMGTPVGTPPNAIALGALTEAGFELTFLDWMILALPLTLVVLGIAWFVLVRLYPADTDRLEVSIDTAFVTTPAARVFYGAAGATIVLWLTEPLHGLASSTVGLLPVVVLLATRVFDAEDLQQMPWHVLWLVAGGIALGTGVAATGLDAWLVDLVPWSSVPAALLLAALAFLALGMSTLISNSATANLLVPIGLSIAASDAVDIAPLLGGVLIAVGCSLAMALPISTPPNAVAYSTGYVRTPDLARTGLIVGGIGLALFVVVGPPLWRALGMVPS